MSIRHVSVSLLAAFTLPQFNVREKIKDFGFLQTGTVGVVIIRHHLFAEQVIRHILESITPNRSRMAEKIQLPMRKLFVRTVIGELIMASFEARKLG